MLLFYSKAILAGLTTGIAIAIPLGPAAIEAISRSLKHGFMSGFEVSLGAIAADYLYIVLLNLGLAKLFSLSPTFEGLFWLLSGIVLIFLNKISKKSNKIETEAIKTLESNIVKHKRIKPFSGFIDGFLMTFINPMTLSIWMAASATVLQLWRMSGTLFLSVALISMLAGTLIWFVGLNFLASKGGSLLNKNITNKTSKFVNYFMILLGISFSLLGIYKLFMRG